MKYNYNSSAAQEINMHRVSELLHHSPVSQRLQIKPNPGLNCPVNSDFPLNMLSSRTGLSLGHLFQQYNPFVCRLRFPPPAIYALIIGLINLLGYYTLCSRETKIFVIMFEYLE